MLERESYGDAAELVPRTHRLLVGLQCVYGITYRRSGPMLACSILRDQFDHMSRLSCHCW